MPEAVQSSDPWRCAYCNREVPEQFSPYVIENWTDVNGHLHQRCLHDANGKNFADTCYFRFNNGIHPDTDVEVELAPKMTDKEYTIIIHFKNP